MVYVSSLSNSITEHTVLLDEVVSGRIFLFCFAKLRNVPLGPKALYKEQPPPKNKKSFTLGPVFVLICNIFGNFEIIYGAYGNFIL